MRKFTDFCATQFGTLIIKPVGEECISLRETFNAAEVTLTVEEAMELRDILTEIIVRPVAVTETKACQHEHTLSVGEDWLCLDCKHRWPRDVTTAVPECSECKGRVMKDGGQIVHAATCSVDPIAQLFANCTCDGVTMCPHCKGMNP